MADCLSSDHFSMSYITDAAATMDTMTPVKNVPLVCDGSIFRYVIMRANADIITKGIIPLNVACFSILVFMAIDYAFLSKTTRCSMCGVLGKKL